MKNLARTLLALLFTISLVSCDKDDDDDDKGKTDEKEYETITVNDNILYGKWEHIGLVDSTVLVFENGIMKKYIFDRSTKMPLEYVDYGWYYLSRIVYYDERTDDNYISINYYDSEDKYYYKNKQFYSLVEDILRMSGEYSGAAFIKITD